MRVPPLVSIVVGLLCSVGFASAPGEPLDCSDWVFIEPRSCQRLQLNDNPVGR